MIKTICTCERCGRTFPEKESKTIIIRDTDRVRREMSGERKPIGLFDGFINAMGKLYSKHVKDYCPDCITEIERVMKGEKEDENNISEH